MTRKLDRFSRSSFFRYNAAEERLEISVLHNFSQDQTVAETGFSCPQTREQVINMYFLEHRAKLLDVAAFLDRLDRARPTASTVDFREAALNEAVRILVDGQPQRAKRILDLLSDSTTEIPQSAHGMKGASGAVRGNSGGAS